MMKNLNYQSVKSELSEILHSSRTNIKLQNSFQDFSTKKIIIYGAGYVGRFVCDILIKNGFHPVCFLDVKGEAIGNYAGIPVKTVETCDLSCSDKENSVVILCVISNLETETQIVDTLRSFGYKHIVPYQQKAFSNDFICNRNPLYSEPLIYDYKDEILSCIELFSDEESLETYKNHIIAFSSRKFGNLPFKANEYQYFPLDISFSKGYSRFIDCGAFDGDTIRQLIQLKGIPETIYAYEPDLLNFNLLSKKIDQTDIKSCCLFPCGVSSKTEILRFKSDTVYSGLASAIDQYGDSIIQCIALDDVLKDVAPTFIKMDIEGSEYDALLGAKTMISKYRPDLAICVYHYINHYFEIPLLIDSWNLGYKFYLRTYDSYANETVMYATCEG